jgi:hypothetical protein
LANQACFVYVVLALSGLWSHVRQWPGFAEGFLPWSEPCVVLSPCLLLFHRNCGSLGACFLTDTLEFKCLVNLDLLPGVVPHLDSFYLLACFSIMQVNT